MCRPYMSIIVSGIRRNIIRSNWRNYYNTRKGEDSNFGYNICHCRNQYFPKKILIMDDNIPIEASRKRHLTPVQANHRSVVQKTGQFFVSNGIESVPTDQVGKETSYADLNLTGLFNEADVASNAMTSCAISTQPSCEMAVSHGFDEDNNDNGRSSSPEDEVGQDVDIADVVHSDEQMSTNEFTAQVRVSKNIFNALKADDDVLSSKLAETGCTVRLPRKMKNPVTVVGSSESDVQLACALLKTGTAVSGRRADRPQLTHFVSVRLTEESVRRRLEEFRELVRGLQPDQDLLPDRLFQRPEKLHMSLAMLQLPDEAALQAARDVLEECCRLLRDQPPPEFRLRGLGTFGSASRARVLFSRPEPGERLQAAAELVHGRLCEAGLAARQTGGITLHATLLNTTFLTRGAARRRWRHFRGFEHGPIVERLGEFDFGEVRPAAFEISSLTEKADDGYYARHGHGLLGVPTVPRTAGSLSPECGDCRTEDSVREGTTDGYSELELMAENVASPPSPAGDVRSCGDETQTDHQSPPLAPAGSP